MSAAAQIQYESRVRVRYGVVAFAAALLLVGSQLLQLSGPHSSVDELTLDLIYANRRATIDVIGAVFDMLGLIAVGVLLSWLFNIAKARNPGMKSITRWVAVTGAVISAIMAIAYTVLVASRAHTFVTTGGQGYLEADALTDSGIVLVLPLLLQFGTLLLTIGCIWTSLNVMRVGLVTKLVGYVGVLAGALFLFPIGALVPLVQGLWLAGVAITLVARWPQGDPPAWARGESVPWPAMSRGGGPQPARTRPERGQRRRVSNQDVLAAVEPSNGNGNSNSAPSPSTSAGKRKRKRK